MSPTRKLTALLAGTALLGSGLAAATTTVAQANPAGTGLVISEVYGGGGNSGATLTNDFIELYNPTGSAISVDGWSVQYRSASGTSAQVTEISGEIPAGSHYLVEEGAGSGGTQALPTPDASGGIAMSGANGVVLLVPSTTPFIGQGNLAGNAGLVDMVGYGSSPTSYETANTGVALTSTTAASRTSLGADSDNNANDFDELAPAPQACGCAAPPAEVEVVDATIAEIQGTGFQSPYADAANTYVRTRGVVTAAWPTGGFYSFVIQTAGTGAGTDATPGASDGVWVHQTSGGVGVTVGDFVEVTGPVEEDYGVTKLTYDPTDADGGLTTLTDAHAPVTALAGTYPSTAADREAHESELLDVSGQRFTVTDNYRTNQYAEIGLATGTRPLITPTEVADAQDSAAIAAVEADNLARGVILDDGASTNYLSGADQDTPLPWLTRDNPVRVGSQATVVGPVILDYQFGAWRFQPTHRVTDEGTDVATFPNTRSADSAPQDVGGDLKLATFNVLNYFNTTGDVYGGCTFYNDRDGDPVTDRDCGPTGPRGAAEQEDLDRQQAKIVAAINTLDADIVSLEEIENSVALGEPDRDDALSTLVDALNADAGTTRWAFAPSPDASDLPPVANQDVIRTAFIYDPESTDLVGASRVLVGSPAFSNAREPLAQAFKADGADDAEAFGVIVNHFKSKGSGADDGTGQGNANPDRVAQAEALVDFADEFSVERSISKLFLTGDFNAYSMEDPIQVLEDAGYTNLQSDTPDEWSYNFGSMAGSLDHVLANEAALGDVTGVDIWNINADEAVAFEYSRHNYNVIDFYAPDVFRASDHDPEIVGISTDGAEEPGADARMRVKAPHTVIEDRTKVKLRVTLRGEKHSSHSRPTGTVEVTVDGRTWTERVRHGKAKFDLGRFSEPGRYDATVTYLGDDTYAPATKTVTFTVRKKGHHH